jgi:hypothetical protein
MSRDDSMEKGSRGLRDKKGIRLSTEIHTNSPTVDGRAKSAPQSTEGRIGVTSILSCQRRHPNLFVDLYQIPRHDNREARLKAGIRRQRSRDLDIPGLWSLLTVAESSPHQTRMHSWCLDRTCEPGTADSSCPLGPWCSRYRPEDPGKPAGSTAGPIDRRRPRVKRNEGGNCGEA